MKEKILIFAGTQEGRILAEHLCKFEKEVHIFVATEYGEEVLPESEHLYVHQGRLEKEKMQDIFSRESCEYIIDATHPYAVDVSENIKEACKATGKRYMRLLREESTEEMVCIYVDSKEEAAEYLNKVDGNILFTTGSKDLEFYLNKIADISRVYVRILTDANAVERCRKLGLQGKQIICMQGPFSAELNAAMLKQFDIQYMVTKETGVTGGFPQKLTGAKMAGAKVVTIRRPEEPEGWSMEELLSQIGVASMRKAKRKISLLGIGMGSEDTMTLRGRQVCAQADVILGAERIVKSLESFRKPMEAIYQAEVVKNFLKEHLEYQNVVVAFSGDVGFYSGTSQMLQALSKEEYDIELVCGISSPIYAASKFQIPWQDMKLMSMHGRLQNVIAAVRTNGKVFVLVEGKEGVRKLAQKLLHYEMDKVVMHVGYQLSYPEEVLQSGEPENFLEYNLEGLSVVILENKDARKNVVTHGLLDEHFIRGNAPMTKEEIRSISLSKLALRKDSVVYDVGAGTGSIGIECALQAVDGQVYAIEKKRDAITLLEKNKLKMYTDNLEIIEGTAPDAMKELPVPTHAFIGGSSGNMKEIIECLLQKNPKVRIVINAIAVDTISEVMQLIKNDEYEVKEIVQVQVSKAKELGSYQMMMGQNPVYIFTLQKER